MNIKDVISKKKYGGKLSEEEIDFFVKGYVDERIPDYQAAAFLMTVYFNGMDADETAWLTKAMAESGDCVDLSSIPGRKADKHSTGGVGDKISLVVMPVMAELGIPVAKMSGRGLGHTGGTIDKLESIPGFRVEMSSEDFLRQVQKHGIALVGQSGNMTPADKKIYALRDAIECVDSIPLIASSIMSKKIASGADVIVLDVKVGRGAFMKDPAQGKALAEAMVSIGKSLGRNTVAVLTAMDQPLGREVGNANEVAEAVRILGGGGEPDEVAVATEICTHMAH
ncbi:MAG: thymidine phosphorylase, partial [Bacillota bacterium]|nr:thymidine phosphorylase [Bacillota bacterium]